MEQKEELIFSKPILEEQIPNEYHKELSVEITKEEKENENTN